VGFRPRLRMQRLVIAQVALDGRWLQLNEVLGRVVGYPVEELLTKTFQDITHPDDLDTEVAQSRLCGP
jgi:PAS domain S-box-containing protein